MSRYAEPAEGSWTEHDPELGTEPMSYGDESSRSRWVTDAATMTLDCVHEPVP